MEEDDLDPWDTFWLCYPRHEAKKDALKAWKQVDADQHIIEILTALSVWRKIWEKKNYEFIPLPATWIRGERWEDEVPREFKQHASQQPAVLPEPGKKSEMPQEVKDLIAKLRAKNRG
jgi:hypothetical protein